MIIYVIIIIILFRYIFEKIIIIAKENVNDLNIFRIILIMKIEVAFIIISKLFKFDVVDLRITIDEIYKVAFIKSDFSKKMIT